MLKPYPQDQHVHEEEEDVDDDAHDRLQRADHRARVLERDRQVAPVPAILKDKSETCESQLHSDDRQS
jgi:hypothetical protein